MGEIDELKDFRKELHQYPEISCHEKNTSERITKKLDQTGIGYTKLNNYGILVKFQGASQGTSILVRGDFDALPIQEINDFEHKSKNEGVSHKCGHDGHTAILLGLAYRLQKNPPVQGTAYLIFQPAEENGHGAAAVLKDQKFDITPDCTIALHNLPGYAKGTIVCREKIFTAAARSIIFEFHGKTSHAAEPELGINPAEAMAKTTLESLTYNNENPEKDDFFLVTPVYSKMGEKAYGVSAGYGEVHLTLRCWDNDLMEKNAAQIEAAGKEIGARYGLNVKTSWLESFAANQNDAQMVQRVKNAAQELSYDFTERPYPFKWGEDFGLFTQKFQGAMFGIGSGENCPALHNPDYDFPDEIIEPAINMFENIVKQSIEN